VYVSELTKIQLHLKAAIRTGINLWLEDEHRRALDHFESVRHFFDGEPEYLRHLHCNKGIVLRALGRCDEAIDEYKLALQIEVGSEEEKSDVAAVRVNLACALIYSNRAEEAFEHLDYAEDFFQKSYENHHLGEVLEARARALSQLGKHEEAIVTAKQSLDILWSYFDSTARERAARTLIACWAAQHVSD
jgi:tetratricopeptide (TPR) repeat protein